MNTAVTYLNGCLFTGKGVWQGSPHRYERYGIDGVLEFDEAAEVRRDVADHRHDHPDGPDGEEEADVPVEKFWNGLKRVRDTQHNYRQHCDIQ